LRLLKRCLIFARALPVFPLVEGAMVAIVTNSGGREILAAITARWLDYR
jgi:dihydroxyacetone kinase DhaKLM complex PTS-EIIA-like component DhaM